MGDSWEILNMEDVPEYIEEHGVCRIEEFFKAKLERWKDVEINIGVIGDCGVGKSSFINAIRGLKDDDEGAATTGVTQTTREATVYFHPTNNKFRFWDLPGTGTQHYPDFETYWEKVSLEKCDTFLILYAGRFTNNDLLLAKKVKSIKKSLFFARTKIDQDIDSERKLNRAFNEEATLNHIREDCLVNLKGLVADDKDVFLISNCETAKWDFDRLTQAILDVLPFRQKKSLSLFKDLLKRKVEILRGRIWMVAGASAVGAVIPVPGLSIAVDVVLLTKEVNFYKSQLGLPEENSDEFRRLTPENQEKVRKFCLTSAVDIAKLLKAYSGSFAVEAYARYIPFVGVGIAFSSTYYFLNQCLKEMEETAMAFLDETSSRVVDEYVNQVEYSQMEL